MNIINSLKINFLYRELKSLQLSDEELQAILSNSEFHSQYKTVIIPFIKQLKSLEMDNYDSTDELTTKLNDDVIREHLQMVVELSKKNKSSRYVSFVNDNCRHQLKIKNYQVFYDDSFDEIYNLIRDNIFNDNISEIISHGYGGRLVEFIKNNRSVSISNLHLSIFEDKVWNIISQNPMLGDKKVVELYQYAFNILVNLINNDLFEGLKYSYEHIPESHNFITFELPSRYLGTVSVEQFSMEFINNVGEHALKKLYSRYTFLDESEFKKLFQIASCGNYELIQDIINYDNDFKFKNISESDMQKKLLETNIGKYDKQELFVNKYFGIVRKDIYYIRLFLNSINAVSELPFEFKEKYGSILGLLNQVLMATDEELVNLSQTFSSDKKEELKKLIYMCEKDGNDILKHQFVEDLKRKNQQITDTIQPKSIITTDGKSINVYELNGQPFTMLVHSISDNNASIHNSFVAEIVNNPENWEQIVDGNNHISTSLISDKYMKTYGTPDNENTIMFGFSELPWETLKFTDVSDAGLNRKASLTDDAMDYNMRKRATIAVINTISSVDYLMDQTIKMNLRKLPSSRQWTEIGLSRIIQTTGKKVMPNYIVCMDYISETSKKAASYFNIPIYLINRKYYPELPYMNENVDLIQSQSDDFGEMKL